MTVSIKEAYEFATAVAKAITDAGIKNDKGCIMGIITVMGDEEMRKQNEPPVGCSINWDEKRSAWMVDVDMVHMVPSSEDPS